MSVRFKLDARLLCKKKTDKSNINSPVDTYYNSQTLLKVNQHQLLAVFFLSKVFHSTDVSMSKNFSIRDFKGKAFIEIKYKQKKNSNRNDEQYINARDTIKGHEVVCE